MTATLIAASPVLPPAPSDEGMRRLLAGLLVQAGSTPDGVADFLRAKGYRGERKDAFCCPVANWLRDFGFDIVEVTPRTVFVQNGQKGWSVPTPTAIGTFVQRFDAGVHLDLVAQLVVTR